MAHTRGIRPKRITCVLVGILAGAVVAPALGAAPPDPKEVASAIERGVSYLREVQARDGHWDYRFDGDHTLGMTALAGLAMLENGVALDDDAIRRASEVVRTLARNSPQTYDLSLAILFLARVQGASQGPNDALIRQLARRLAAGGRDGIWTYTVPVRPELEVDPDDQTIGTTRARRRSLNRLSRGMSGGDHSNTQFALLGLWAASRHGYDPSVELESIDDHFRGTSDSRGGWGYVPGDGTRDAMTCAGLMGLTVAAARPAVAERQTARARGAALAADPAFTRALRIVGESARQINGQSDIYFLWSLERVCVALGLRHIEGFDWYAAGARELLDRQRADVGWPDERWGSLPNTCLALLFLRKANLAFEIDRVLRLPGEQRDETVVAEATDEEEPGAPVGESGAQGQSRVVITAASDRAFPEVTVDFEVRNPDGTFVVDARREAFQVTEDGRPVEILKFSSPMGEASPITVVLVVDRSLSMENEDRIGGLKQAVASFTHDLPPGSRVAVIAFGSNVSRLCPFTSDMNQVREVVNRLTPAGATRYYDAVAEALELLEREPGRRAVLALTDGEDTFSQNASLESVTTLARRLGLPVHTLGLGTEDEIEAESLKRLALDTRGQYYPAREADQLRKIYQELATRLRSSYTVTYRSDRRIPDGTLRPVRVAYVTGGTASAGETAIFIPGMVVPAPGWSRLFLLMLAGIALIAALTRRKAHYGRSDA
ncbi:MAG: VWA domain-containing protein [Isosphaeraceae bacterium]